MLQMKDKLMIVFMLILFLAFCQSCKDLPTTPSWDYPLQLETQNFIFHYSTGDSVESTHQEAFHGWATQQLSVICPKKIDYFKYESRDHMEAITGKDWNGWADPEYFAVHSIWSWDNHECVHLYTSIIGRPPDFFNEGISVAFSTDPYNNDFEARWWSEPVHYWARRFKNEGTLIPIDHILETNAFRSYHDEITYPESGSFVRFLIDTHGLNKIKNFFEVGNRIDSKEVIKQNFQLIYGLSIEQAEDQWLTFLDSY